MVIPKKESTRSYRIERDPNPNYRLFACDFEDDEVNELDWN